MTPSLPGPFSPAWWARNPHVQTLAGKYLRPEPVLPVTRERWETPDGDFLDLDFMPDRGRPRVLVLHGLEGHSRRRYVLNTLTALRGAGLDGVALNFRHCSGEPNRRARTYHSGETADLGFVLTRLREAKPGGPLGVVGFSLGGNVLLKYLGERSGAETPAHAPGPLPDAAVAISVPYDLAAGAELLSRSVMGRGYTRYFLRSLHAKVREKESLLRDQVSLPRVYAARTLPEFDDALTAPLNGFRDAAHYYEESSATRYLDRIRTPTLALHAADDPFLPRRCIPRDALEANPAIQPIVTPRGGHVGFVGPGSAHGRFWAEAVSARFLQRHLDPDGVG